MQTRPPFIVFSDLDGTLLDHTTYAWDPAKPALAGLAQSGIPVILATSKTAAETKALQRQMDLQAYPAIVENGAGVATSGDATDTQTDDYTRLRAILADLPPELRAPFTGFGDMSVDDVAHATGLSTDAARQAQMRCFSEPGLWHGTADEQDAFVTALAEQGVAARKGGRFLTLSFGKTKKDRMAEITAQFGAQMTIALGDAPNDVEMLEAADFGVIVSNPHHTPLPRLGGEDTGRIIRTDQAGPVGWNAAINAFLDRQHTLMKGIEIG